MVVKEKATAADAFAEEVGLEKTKVDLTSIQYQGETLPPSPFPQVLTHIQYQGEMFPPFPLVLAPFTWY